MSRGCETRELALPRDGQGRLGFEVDAEGFITHVERFTFAETTGLRPGARLLRVCGQTLPKLGPEAAAQMLRSAPKVCVTVLPPDESGRPRRSGHPACGEVGGLGSWSVLYLPRQHRQHAQDSTTLGLSEAYFTHLD